MPLVAHHVEINLFDLIVIEPETMPEHAVLAAVSAVLVVLICYGARAAIRDTTDLVTVTFLPFFSP